MRFGLFLGDPTSSKSLQRATQALFRRIRETLGNKLPTLAGVDGMRRNSDIANIVSCLIVWNL
jgi:hypothetical protein